MRTGGFGLALLFGVVAAAGATTQPPPCAMAAQDRLWVNKSLEASRYVLEQRLKLPAEEPPTIILFDGRCRFEAKSTAPTRWATEAHQGKIRLPGGDSVDAGVTSFASLDEQSGERFFVMALPSVWTAAGLTRLGDGGLTAVLLHEFSHTRQLNTLKPAFDAAAEIYEMPDDFSDDSLQKHFESDPTYVAVIEKEIDLLFEAAAEPDERKARARALQALKLLEARQNRWFVGDEFKWKPYDDIFTTMEGFGQWVAYVWLADPRGGGMTADAARKKMAGTRWWSQNEGLALFLVIDRFVPDWAAKAFGAPPMLGIDLLREAVAGAASGELS